MLIEVADTVVSTELFERKFVCDLQSCKGACCIEGDSGAPLQLEEIDLIEDNLEEILPFLREEGVQSINREGVFYMDQENEPVTTLVGGKECAFVVYEGSDRAMEYVCRNCNKKEQCEGICGHAQVGGRDHLAGSVQGQFCSFSSKGH